MEFHVESADAALEKCWQLVREGQADLFRGQTRDWPELIPSLFRTSGEDQADALKELEYFKEWSKFVPQMVTYGGNDASITAIAQHYGIPTAFLDLTTNPEIALIFAKYSSEGDGSTEAVVYCFLESALKALSSAKIMRIDVRNLWRLEAQKGLFLHCRDEGLGGILRNQSIRIYFPSPRLSEGERRRIYPVRKSALEVAIDQWVYRREIERAMEIFKDVPYKSMTHRETYPQGDSYVEIMAREDGMFCFGESSKQEDDGYVFWAPTHWSGLYSDAATAEREARATLPWLRELDSN